MATGRCCSYATAGTAIPRPWGECSSGSLFSAFVELQVLREFQSSCPHMPSYKMQGASESRGALLRTAPFVVSHMEYVAAICGRSTAYGHVGATRLVSSLSCNCQLGWYVDCLFSCATKSSSPSVLFIFPFLWANAVCLFGLTSTARLPTRMP